MKRLRILPANGPLAAEVTVPGSKSYTNRALFIGALTSGAVVIKNALRSDDTQSMADCLKQLGIQLKRSSSDIKVIGDISAITDKNYHLDCGLSGVTLRFMLALACVVPGQQIIDGDEGLRERPVGDMVDSLRRMGADIKYLGKKGYPPLKITSSSLSGGSVSLPGGGSSQYLSALLMIAPLIDGGLHVRVTGTLGSKPYVDMTMEAMKQFGVRTTQNGHIYQVAAKRYQAGEYKVEGDISSACYFFAIAALTSSTITVKGVNPRSLQADMGFLTILRRMGAKVSHGQGSITVQGHGVKALAVDMHNCPDQAQTLAVLAAFADGVTTIKGVRSLRIKETERVQALEQELAKMGIKTSSTADTLKIHGGNPNAACIATYGDHRMAMSFAVAGTVLSGMAIQDPEVVTKTFPDFWKRLGGIGIRTRAVRPNIVLIGMRGSGKTTVARKLARKLDVEHWDLDEIMAQKLELSTPEIVEKHGWGYFREQEAAIAQEISSAENMLISTGGGVVLKPENVAALKRNGYVVLLRASADVLVRRLGDASDRPPLTKARSLEEEVRQVMRDRQTMYESAADLIIDTDDLRPSQVANRILARFKEASS